MKANKTFGYNNKRFYTIIILNKFLKSASKIFKIRKNTDYSDIINFHECLDNKASLKIQRNITRKDAISMQGRADEKRLRCEIYGNR